MLIYSQELNADDAPGAVRLVTGRSQGNGSDMTEPDKEQLDYAEKLENIVDRLDEKVAGERESEGVPGKPSDREHAPIRGSEHEPPD